MKKLYNNTKGKIHPSPHHFSDQLAFLPAAIFTLTLTLSPEDREVLAYLISCSGNLTSFSSNRKKNYGGGGGGFGSNGGGLTEHSTSFNCECFRCYTSFWVRWDCSPNRQLIHEIIDAYEDGNNQFLSSTDHKSKKFKNKKERRKKKKGSFEINNTASSIKITNENENEVVILEMKQFEAAEEIFDSFEMINGVGDITDNDIEEVKEQDLEKGSMRKLISFVGGSIWSVWG
ncbi:hypothetical protein MKW94_009525 [Papaver nudicaule]|uniref:Uncharacterized protein n=1 Tax=Papaver nudicaule TaxID=74823 RepID=A0AA41RPY6_PAPNU|nr:hypothetical protein [Papaver nudicaule]